MPTRVLIVEDNPGDARRLEGLLAVSGHQFEVDRVTELSSALTALIHRTFDVLFLDLTLSDSQGIETVHAVLRVAPQVPIIVLSGTEDLATAMNCVQAGASSYLVKGFELTSQAVEREALYAVERGRQINGLRKLAHAAVTALQTGGHALVPHVDAVDRALEKSMRYLSRNFPAAHQQLLAAMTEDGAAEALRELRALCFPAPAGVEAVRTLGDELVDTQAALEACQRSLRRVVACWVVTTLGASALLGFYLLQRSS